MSTVGWLRVCALVVCGVGCGRVGFSPAGSGDGATEDAQADAEPDAQLFSCGLPHTCGPMASESCCDSPLLPGGTFMRGYDLGSDGMFSTMANTAMVAPVRLDRFEVTVGRFRRFVDAGMGTQQNPPASGAGARMLNGLPAQGGWDPAWNAELPADTATLVTDFQICDGPAFPPTPGSTETLAVACMSWYLAFAYCAWDGGFLPTEAEFNYAASGGDQQRAYPWSQPASLLTADCTYANFSSSPTTRCSPTTGGQSLVVGATSPLGDGRWGHADLGGNVWEWTLDWYNNMYPNPCDNCARLASGTSRVFRGGSFFSVPLEMRSGRRNAVPPDSRYSDFGVRCARAP